MVENVTQKALWLRRGSVGGIPASRFLWEMRGLQVHLPPSPPPTPLKQKQAPPLIVTMLRSTTVRVHSDRWVRSYLEEGVRKVLCG